MSEALYHRRPLRRVTVSGVDGYGPFRDGHADYSYERVEMTVCGTCHGAKRVTNPFNTRLDPIPCPACLSDDEGNPTGYVAQRIEPKITG